MKWTLGLYRGYIGDIVFYLGIPWYPIMENQMEKKMENEMETRVI